ncbi:dTDP-glucose 4,6-dehydratase [Desulfosporosinus hippei]|uniref:dTDP-glucose 4,6-dehydratase n=1 Tax=Desulfosporosinus hippei DSM 8344 TaxID=1121419 RepID=A0A1G7U2X3_9FIRM|nr:dTDP-glucose 4,6-dehydratase [Desulfosporosinus hippei]SDG41906.1 dTDP-glucose 4,6-dehydratase [Desulfosporosinus hippei DSM 8344]
MRILVTGGAGFIGSNYLLMMADKYPGDCFINVDSLTYAGNLKNLISLEDRLNYIFYKVDICDSAALEAIFQKEKPDAIIHFAAESHVDRSIENPLIFAETNVLGTINLINYACRYGVSRYVQVSTDEVYGSLGREGLFTENTPLMPNSPYSASKASADCFVRAAVETYGLNASITRCSNNYGPYQFPEKLIPLMIWRAIENMPLPLYGDGLNIRDWLYVDDHCRAIDTVLRQGQAGEVYNVGGNNERTNLEIVKEVLRILNKSDSLIQFVTDRPGHDRRYAIDSSKIKRHLNWVPNTNFWDGIGKTVQWYLNNERWWREIISGEYQSYYSDMYNNR